MAEITYREALRRALREELQRDSTVVIWGEDIVAYGGGGAYGVTAGLAKEFPGRVRDVPIAEEAIVGVGIGAAMGGIRPVCELMTINFSLVAWDQIVNHAAKQSHMFNGNIRVPMVIRSPAGWGRTAATHSQTFENWLASIPGLKVVYPATPHDAKGLLKASIRDDDPVFFIEHLALYGTKGEVPDQEYVLPIGVSERKRAGGHVTVVTWGRMLVETLKAARTLEAEGIELDVIDLRTLRPLDLSLALESARKTHRVVVVEEGFRAVGLGAEIAASVQEQAFNDLDAPVARVAGLEVPMPYAKSLERATIPFADDVAAAVRAMLAKQY
jgi:pyruvate dehydrogenase E1 component beta subunit